MNDCKSVFGLFDFFSIQNQLNARLFLVNSMMIFAFLFLHVIKTMTYLKEQVNVVGLIVIKENQANATVLLLNCNIQNFKSVS